MFFLFSRKYGRGTKGLKTKQNKKEENLGFFKEIMNRKEIYESLGKGHKTRRK